MSDYTRRTLLFFVTEDYYFVSHRLPIAIAARGEGYDVGVITRVRDHGGIIRDAGLRLIPFENVRSGLNPFSEIVTLVRLIRLYRRERPVIVHHVAMKPVLYGSLAARLTPNHPRVVNAIAGMGWMFTSRHGVATWLQCMVRWALRHAAGSGIAIVQNPDDEGLIQQLGGPAVRVRRISGSGVDLAAFAPRRFPPGPRVVLLPARMLWDKGVGEFVDAARILRTRGVQARFVLAGEPDPLNPASIPQETISGWVRDGIVEYRGWVADMPALLASTHVVTLPSYREGMPKSLIEAAAAGRPIVTTDVPGCRAVVRNGENGLLVPARDATGLADAIQRLLDDEALCTRMGATGRMYAEQEFGIDAVVQRTLAVYREVSA